MREDVEHRECLATGQNHYPGPRSPVHQPYDNVAKKTRFSMKGGIFSIQLFCI